MSGEKRDATFHLRVFHFVSDHAVFSVAVNNIILGLSVTMFIVGIILIAFIAWWLNGLAYVSADEYFVWEKYR